MRAGRLRALVDVHLAVSAREACGAATLVVVDEVDALLAGGAGHPGAVVNVLLAVGARVAQQAGAGVVCALAALQSSAVQCGQLSQCAVVTWSLILVQVPPARQGDPAQGSYSASQVSPMYRGPHTHVNEFMPSCNITKIINLVFTSILICCLVVEFSMKYLADAPVQAGPGGALVNIEVTGLTRVALKAGTAVPVLLNISMIRDK